METGIGGGERRVGSVRPESVGLAGDELENAMARDRLVREARRRRPPNVSCIEMVGLALNVGPLRTVPRSDLSSNGESYIMEMPQYIFFPLIMNNDNLEDLKQKVNQQTCIRCSTASSSSQPFNLLISSRSARIKKCVLKRRIPSNISG